MKLSIIVPAYNVEKYIANTITSLLNQDLNKNEYEVIIVNDGSKDNTLFEVKRFVEDSRIKIIDKKNGGVSSARNRGLEVASGEYVVFVDGDDQIFENGFSKIIDKLDVNQFDVVAFQFFDKATQTIESINIEEVSPEDLYNIHRQKLGISDSSCVYFFSKYFLSRNNIKYNENIDYLEDGFFLAQLLAHNPVCAITNAKIYKRIYREDSATASKIQFKDKNHKSFLNAVEAFIEFKRDKLNAIIIEHALVKFITLYLDTFILRKLLIKYFMAFRKVKRIYPKIDTNLIYVDYRIRKSKTYNLGSIFYFLNSMNEILLKRKNNK